MSEVTKIERSSHHDRMPWAWCNLSRNPFGELTRQERAEVAVVDVSGIAALVQNDFSAVQLIGQCGRGKTTRMLALHHGLPDSTYAYLPQDGPCPSIASGRPVLIDEAQRLPRRIRGAVFQSGLPLVLATHRDLSRPLRRSGYSVTTYEIGAGNNAAHLCELLNRRIQASCLDARSPVPQVSLDDATKLVQRFGSDVRAIEGYLYDMVQSQTFCGQDSHSKDFSSQDQYHGEMRFND